MSCEYEEYGCKFKHCLDCPHSIERANINETTIKASRKAELTKEELFNVFAENGLIGVYNLGMKHMYKYLEGK